MHTRSGLKLSKSPLARHGGQTAGARRKRVRASKKAVDFFDGLPDDLVLLTVSKLSSTASAPADLVNLLLTCRRFNGLGTHPMVLSIISARGLSVRASTWSESAHRFLKRCADAGSLEACYTLGMIRFYCLENRGSGASLMAKAAMGSHSAALYSLAVIQFNGSGGSKNEKDLRAGVALCARAAYFGHIDALRELGHCLQDGYGVKQNIGEGRRFLLLANARELTSVLSNQKAGSLAVAASSLLSDFGCTVPAVQGHDVNRFMVEWFEGKGEGRDREGLMMCSHGACGRPETRRHEFRRCSVCGVVNYCSRACQAMHWKIAHKLDCATMERWLDGGEGIPAAGEDGGDVNFEGQ
ncbi:hypothetical protein M5K25_008430 [Dendrobium thyrsiflorum]|uniref:MYND-type domain-containing protein n=1 Tax=Dendrobium thyrsiflorum TaxID=117978 RepID=A0ABD0VFC6_DENTH